jgi:hypothetical protein
VPSPDHKRRTYVQRSSALTRFRQAVLQPDNDSGLPPALDRCVIALHRLDEPKRAQVLTSVSLLWHDHQAPQGIGVVWDETQESLAGDADDAWMRWLRSEDTDDLARAIDAALESSVPLD